MLKTEEEFMNQRVRLNELDPTRGISTRPRSPKYRENDAGLKDNVVRFDLIVNPTEAQILTHLRACQYRLAGNNFDDWDQ